MGMYCMDYGGMVTIVCMPSYLRARVFMVDDNYGCGTLVFFGGSIITK